MKAAAKAAAAEPETIEVVPVAAVAAATAKPADAAKAVAGKVVAEGAADARRYKRGFMGHVGLGLIGAVNAVCATGFGLLAYRYAEQPWPIAPLFPAETASVTPAPSQTPSPRPLSTATIPQQPEQPAARPQPVEKSAQAVPPVSATPDAPPAATPTPPTPNATPPTPATTATSPAPPADTQPVAAAPIEPAAQAHRLLTKEADYIARLDALLGPTRTLSVTVEDATRVRDAFAAASNVPAVRALRDQISDPVARKLIDWQLLRSGAGTAREVRNFLAENPDWPNRDLMTQRSEEYVFMSGGTARDIKATFADQEPRTAIGRAALASALLAEQDEEGAARLAGWAWRDGDIPALLETGFIERFGKILKPEDHKWRLDRMLMDESRWENERAAKAVYIRRVIPFLSELEKAKANARLAIYLRAPDANKLMAALPADAATVPKADWGFAFQLAQWHRRAGRTTEAWDIVLNAPTDASLAVSLDDWWELRRLSAYDALKAGKPEIAYELVKSPGNLGVNPRKDWAFMAGWLALQHLKNPKAAEGHFRELQLAADGPLSRGKAGWWLSKTYDALGDPARSKASLEEAAKNTDTFYGMMARQILSGGKTTLEVNPPQVPTKAEADKFNARDAVKALVIARRSGLDPSVTRAFLAHLRNVLPSEPEQAMVAHMAEAIGDTQMAVRVAKSAVARGLNLITYAYPIHPMPAYQPLRPAPEPAMLLGVARQESEFFVSTKSGAGARGLLQVMPITANHVCKDYRLKCEIDRLSTDPAYNVMMASAYIADRMDEFTGSYVLTLAGYNAGPGRTRQWIREFGDPRDPNVDPIDWIHRIPFEETRDYVVKVLSNIQIYRARLGDEANALRLTTDLRRIVQPTFKRAAAASGG